MDLDELLGPMDPATKDDVCIPFLIAPALVNDQPVDVSSAKGTKVFRGATSSLLTMSDGDLANLRIFLAKLNDHSMLFG